MTRMTLNNTVSFPINGYNRYTNLQDGNVYSNANIEFSGTEFYNDIVGLADDVIDALKIDVDGNTIYDIRYQNGKITNISENLFGESMNLTMTITFTMGTEENNASNNEII